MPRLAPRGLNTTGAMLAGVDWPRSRHGFYNDFEGCLSVPSVAQSTAGSRGESSVLVSDESSKLPHWKSAAFDAVATSVRLEPVEQSRFARTRTIWRKFSLDDCERFRDPTRAQPRFPLYLCEDTDDLA